MSSLRKRQLNKVVLSADFRPPRSKRVACPARSELLAPPEASCSPRSKRVTRPARSVLLAPPEASCSPRPKRVVRLARSVLLALLEASCSPRSKRVVRPARSVLLALLRSCLYTPSEVYHLTPSETVPLPRVRQYP